MNLGVQGKTRYAQREKKDDGGKKEREKGVKGER